MTTNYINEIIHGRYETRCQQRFESLIAISVYNNNEYLYLSQKVIANEQTHTHTHTHTHTKYENEHWKPKTLSVWLNSCRIMSMSQRQQRYIVYYL